MNRRDSFKYLAAGSIASGFLLSGCDWFDDSQVQKSLWKYKYGRTSEEIEHDNFILSQQFFTTEEIATITTLAHLILPPNEFGDIEKAEVPELIEFMAKDYPPFQSPLREGLAELNERALSTFGEPFQSLENTQMHSLLEPIAYPQEVDDELKNQAAFFTLVRNLTLTGYYTSEVGIKDLGYQGNQPNVWDGVPQDVLQQHNMAYDEQWMPKFLDVNTRNEQAMWDENGNLLT
jgi:hypothetical protein